MKEFVDYTMEPEQWQRKYARLDITGQRSEKIATNMSKHARNVGNLEALIIYQHKNCKESFRPLPFAKWGMDILGPFPLGRGQTKFMIIAMDYFTKWIEAKALTKITAQQVQTFV